MSRLGIQFMGKHSEMPMGKTNLCYESIEQYAEVKKVLEKLQAGYTERDIEKVDTFMEDLFINGEATYALGTGTEEMFFGSEQVKTLISDDWEYWGDVSIDWKNALISSDGEVAWFAAAGSVKQSFEDTPERYDSYLNFIKNKAEEAGITPKQKITFINWVLALTYHQRLDKKREYLCPLCLSGVLLKDIGKWKIVHLHFSIPKANFPDERFENSKEYIDSYNKQNSMIAEYEDYQMTAELRALLKSLEMELVGKKGISSECLGKYFAEGRLPYIIGTEGQWYCGLDQIREFFNESGDSTLSLDLEHAIIAKSGEITWVTAVGIIKQRLTEDELAERALEELQNLFQANLDSKEKLFAAHRSIAYALKESAAGEDYTCPLRMTAVIINLGTGPVFHRIHFSFPFNWIFEGKIDSISINK